jgi:hypothetical protein
MRRCSHAIRGEANQHDENVDATSDTRFEEKRSGPGELMHHLAPDLKKKRSGPGELMRHLAPDLKKKRSGPGELMRRWHSI